MNHDVSQSIIWRNRARRVIPDGTSTLSKTSRRLVEGISPMYMVRGEGAYCYDVDGNKWLDAEMAMGTLLFGHSHPYVIKAAQSAIRRGTSFSTPTPDDVLYAEMLLRRFVSYEQVRFMRSGNDAIQAACRLARCHTGRDKVAYTEYHGWADGPTISLYGNDVDPRYFGVSSCVAMETISLSAREVDPVRDIMHDNAKDLAAVVLCPNSWQTSELKAMLSEAHKLGSLVIFDEISCGMRLGQRGSFDIHGIVPDLLCISKGMAAGLPLSAVLGSKKLLDLSAQARITNAHATESVAFAVGIAVERLLAKEPLWPSWKPDVETLMSKIKTKLDIREELVMDGDVASFSVRDRRFPDFWSDPFREHLLRVCAQDLIFTKGYVVPSAAHGRIEFERIYDSFAHAIETYKGIVR
ncbi:aminotransferase class III-fold pyridoxal phosphate-dependent enzyme [Trueperella pyogenes]|uniref:aminotransferase class III-fold pyridoxal phosphate-dependent enzyme n=1 Tax=Trueperella pyogenes TaxID=1661 RepID=UPI000F8588C1|nr:aminotransferase class III-fold pyridoxal phosphate-dependent enzyme [Trueperella pyogenes]AZR03011.1 aminotransferase class III-fold pyridoxal phosphate-dependent enzyme [Trueperella pyogenes]